MRVLVTGAAGFIGMHLALRLKRDGADVAGVDSFDPYYDIALKRARADRLAAAGVPWNTLDLADAAATLGLLRDGDFSHVAHLAAQPGVRYSLVNPGAYLRNNVDAFGAVLEGCRHASVAHLVYASSSSVYGANHTLPFSEDQNVDHPVSLYAATKKANELMAHCYSHLYGLPSTGLRFFTVYGPWGRPDMAMWLFTDAIMQGRPIKLFNRGRMRRDFTYIDDVVEAVVRLVPRPPAANPAWSGDAPDSATSAAPWHVYNIGNSQPVEVTEVVRLIEEAVGKPAVRELLPMQPGDVPETCADVADLERAVGFRPKTSIGEGVGRFVDWFLRYGKK
jgi:UDP-glucuronate 4-epimerase